MVAATRIVTKEDCVNSLKKGRRGRPTILDTHDLISAAQRGESWRQAVNSKYVSYGFTAVSAYLGEGGEVKARNMFQPNDRRILYQGVLEQIGREAYKLGEKKNTYLSIDDLWDMIEITLEMIDEGRNSKDIERWLRTARIWLKNSANRN